MIFSRQNLPTIDRTKFANESGLHKGAYVIADLGDKQPEIILMATGSEVDLIIKTGEKLQAEGKSVRLVSFPSWDLFEAQPQSYKDQVLDPKIEKRVAVEAGSKLGWEKWVGTKGAVVGMSSYGASAPAEILFKEFGFTVDNVYQIAKGLF